MGLLYTDAQERRREVRTIKGYHPESGHFTGKFIISGRLVPTVQLQKNLESLALQVFLNLPDAEGAEVENRSR